MDYVNGGQLLGVLRKEVMLSERWVIFYGAETLAAIGALHSAGIIHRDLKPENILLDSEGHVVLTDFGFSKVLAEGERTRSFCGTFEYMAPETISEASHSFEADYWSLGILLYDLLTGRPPFRGASEEAMRNKVMTGRIKYPKYLTTQAISLLKRLLQRDVSARLANLQEAKAHPFFRSIDWRALEAREVTPPYRPPVSSPHDTSMYDEDVVGMAHAPSSPANPIVVPEDVEAFKDFSFAASPGKYFGLRRK
jgi:p70 ribosomal S6 kinase